MITVIGTFLAVLFMSMAAYCLSRSNFRFKGILTFFIFFPTLFSGGLVPSYIINTQYLHLTDRLAALILPSLINVFHIIMLRTFFKQLPEALFEAAKIDGASEYHIFFKLVLPLSKPVIATVAFLSALAKWNEWYNAMLYIRDDKLVPLQYLLQRMMMNLRALLDAMQNAPAMVNIQDLPGENLRMAMLVVAIGPMLLIFPLFQKYFVRGMTVGAVKG
ncbi:carbohydrate ABC transporter permease [uncultured Robinsoniella sp.]|uniref:carbohydrate ABC transporter permease n=1 Tax=Robinsoniella sp. TaxID=2496533 RepID=UPI00374F3094